MSDDDAASAQTPEYGLSNDSRTTPMTESLETSSSEHTSNLEARENLFLLTAQHFRKFRSMIFANRRRSQQRLQQRQAMLRAFYVQQLMEMEISFLELLPVPNIFNKTASQPPDERANFETVDHTGTNESENRLMPLRFYEDVVVYFSDEQWLATFRMTKKTFHWLCEQVREVLQPNGANGPLKYFITLEKHVALALYAFATGADFRSIAVLFNISCSSVCKFLKCFADAFLEKLGACLLSMPKEDDYKEICRAFKEATNMPALVVGVLGVCEIHVSSYTETVNATTNDQSSPKVLLQAVIDDRLLFRKVQMDIQHPTLLVDAPNAITKLGTGLINERFLPHFVVTPATYYPLRPWLMHQYQNPAEPHEYDFNEAIDNLLIFRDKAFRRLFSRWQILLKGNLLPRTLERIATACCALHNLLEENEERFLEEEWCEDVDVLKLYTGKFELDTNTADCVEAVEIRDFLARTISSTEM